MTAGLGTWSVSWVVKGMVVRGQGAYGVCMDWIGGQVEDVTQFHDSRLTSSFLKISLENPLGRPDSEPHGQP